MALSESEITSETVVIPGELKLSNPVPPPVTVSLPIVAWPSELRNYLLGLFFLAGGLFALSLGVLFGMLVVGFGLRVVNVGLSIWDALLLLVVVPMMIFGVRWGVGCTGATLTCFRDAMRNDPVLEITADGLRDYRSGLSVLWSSVQCARIARNGIGGVILQLREPVKHRQNPFRLGVLFQGYRPKPDHVLVSAAYLDVRAHVLIYTILTLTQWNGGEAISKSAGPNDSGLRLIPREMRLNVRSSPAS
jgi:hypothetical protein